MIFRKKEKLKYSIHLNDSDYKSVITLNGERDGDKINWSWNYSPDLIDLKTGYPRFLPGVDILIHTIADGSTSLEELDKGFIEISFYGKCRVNKYSV